MPTAPAEDRADELLDRLRGVGTVVGPRVIDLGLAGAVTVLVLLDVATGGGDVVTSWLSLLLGLAAVGAVVARRWWLVPSFAALVATVVADGVFHSVAYRHAGYGFPRLAPLAALCAVVTPVVRRERWGVAATAAGAGAVAVGYAVWWPAPQMDLLVFLLGVAGLYLGGVGAGVYLRDLDRQRFLAAVRARTDERLDLARELHDLVAHHVTAIVIQAQAALVVADRDPAAAGESLRQIERAGKESLSAMRRLVGSLRADGDGDGPGSGDGSGPAAPVPGVAALAALAAESDRLGLPVRVDLAAEVADRVPPEVAASAYRIVQESLTNVRRHATGATGATVTLTLDRGGDGPDLLVAVTDDGRAAFAGRADSGGYGLIGMRERAQLLDGHLDAGPLAPPAVGWQVRARLPLGPDDVGAR